jgi:hypothetical protein
MNVACAPLAHQAGIEIAHEADPSLPRLVVDRHRVSVWAVEQPQHQSK